MCRDRRRILQTLWLEHLHLHNRNVGTSQKISLHQERERCARELGRIESIFPPRSPLARRAHTLLHFAHNFWLASWSHSSQPAELRVKNAATVAHNFWTNEHSCTIPAANVHNWWNLLHNPIGKMHGTCAQVFKSIWIPSWLVLRDRINAEFTSYFLHMRKHFILHLVNIYPGRFYFVTWGYTCYLRTKLLHRCNSSKTWPHGWKSQDVLQKPNFNSSVSQAQASARVPESMFWTLVAWSMGWVRCEVDVYFLQRQKDSVNTTRDHFSVSEAQDIAVVLHKSQSQKYTFGAYPQKTWSLWLDITRCAVNQISTWGFLMHDIAQKPTSSFGPW